MVGQLQMMKMVERGKTDGENGCITEIPEELVVEILWRLPLKKLVQIKIVSKQWRRIICGSQMLGNMREQQNMDRCLIICYHDGVALFDIVEQQLFNNILGLFKSWKVRAAGGGLLLLFNEKSGMLRVLNPLTMQSRCLPDKTINRRYGLSYYMKLPYEHFAAEINVDSKANTYQVIVIGNFTRQKLHILIYSSVQRSWEITVVSDSLRVWYIRKIAIWNQRVYCFSCSGRYWVSFNLSGEGRSVKVVPNAATIRSDDPWNECDTITLYKGCITMVKYNPKHNPTSVDIFKFKDEEESSGWQHQSEIILSRQSNTVLQFLTGYALFESRGGNDADGMWVVTEKRQMASLHLDGINTLCPVWRIYPMLRISKSFFTVSLSHSACP